MLILIVGGLNLKRHKFLSIEDEKKLLSEGINYRKIGDDFQPIRNDYYNRKFIKYFWERFPQKIAIHWSNRQFLLFGGILIILLGFNIFLISQAIDLFLQFNYPLSDIITFVIFIAWGGIFSAFVWIFLINVFNVKLFYLIFIILIGLNSIILIIQFDYYSVYYNTLHTTGIFLTLALPFLFFFLFNKRISGVGKIYLHWIAILVSLEKEQECPQIWRNYIANDITHLISGWDDLVAETYKLRIKNVDEVLKELHTKIISKSDDLKSLLAKILTKELIELMRNYRKQGNVLKISNTINGLVECDVQFISDSLVESIKRRLKTTEICILIFGAVSGFFGILGVFMEKCECIHSIYK